MKTILFSLLSLLFISCASAGPKDNYADVVSGKAILIDVRENDEVKEGMIDRAQWIPLSKMEANSAATIEEVKALSSGKDIYVYCRSGRRSQVFINKLKDANVPAVNLGGYQDLLNAGLPKKP